MSAIADIRIVLRADCSPIMGLGHIKRCLSLASALSNAGAKVMLISRDLGVNFDYLSCDEKLERVVLPKPAMRQMIVDHVPHADWAAVDWHLDAIQTVMALKSWKPDWVVVDHYAFDARWHHYISDQLSARMAVIDDLADRDLFADILIDHNFHEAHVDKYRGRVSEHTIILGGPRFALLGSEFVNVKTFSVRERVDSIGIFMGGIDAGNLSGLALRACREVVGFLGTIEIVMTRSYVHANSIKELAAKSLNTYLSCDLPDLADFLSRHDLQIGAGGGATWERCRVGAPSLVLIASSNQQAVLPGLKDTGVAVLELSEDVGESAIAIGREIRLLLESSSLRREMSSRSQALVDGRGSRRVALSLAASTLSVRQASQDDAELIYQWRNHPTTRAVSHDSREIHWTDHQLWLSQVLTNPLRCLLVGHVGTIDVGIIRIDVNESQAEVSLYLDPALYGLGLGSAILHAGEAYAVALYPSIIKFKATVLEGNKSSIRLFESSGYHSQKGIWIKTVNSQLRN